MIIWLASYPRSGNTLVRNILKKSMGLGTYSQHDMAFQPDEQRVDDYGLLSYDGSWQDFYEKAATSDEIYVIKTHFLPTDNHPVIYVTRDGRLSTESYLKQYQHRAKSWPGIDSFVPTYFDLLIGRDYYSDWSNHYNAWLREGRAKRLELRYEDIVEPSKDILEKIAKFVGYEGNIKTFVNERTKGNSGKDVSEKRGLSSWQRPEFRTETEEALFLCLHGELLHKLGYIEKSELDLAVNTIDKSITELSKAALSSSRERYQWMQAAIEKETVIQNLLNERTTGSNCNGFIKKFVRIFK
jgi:hypothetical protein